MRIKFRPLTLYRIVFWMGLAFVVSSLVTIFVVVALPNVFGDKPLLLITILLFLTLMFSFAAASAAGAITAQKQFIAQLQSENSYVLGEPTKFYNLDAFKTRVNKLSRRRTYAKYARYITAFTPTAFNVVSSQNRMMSLRGVNLYLTKYLDKLFAPDNKDGFDHSRNVYGFSRGAFFLCTFTNDSTELHRIITAISNELFRLGNDGKFKIWVQPFYGICEMRKDASVVVAIEDALLARDISEKNYESYTFFKESFRRESGSVGNEIAAALDNDEFIPYYQPKYSLKEKRYISCEALARWNSPTHGVLGPGKFIDEAGKAGLLNQIDLHIFEHSVRDLGENLKKGRPVLPVSVNFSLYEFFSRTFLSTFTDTLKKYQVPAHLIEIEITETTSQVNKFLSLSVIRKLKEMGVRILMDDFGAGYSQVDTLRQIPFDALKIDKSYTDRLLTDDKTRSIFKYLIELGHINGMEVIVEGVETREQVDTLRRMKADTIQGFYYSRAISFQEYNEFLKQQQQQGEGEEK